MTLTATRRSMFINGDWADCVATAKPCSVINPATEEEIADVPEGHRGRRRRAPSPRRAHAFDEWSQTTPGERSKMLWKFAQTIEDNAAELSQLESANVGKPKGVSDFDLEFAVDNLRFFAGAARVIEGKAAGEYTQGLHQR